MTSRRAVKGSVASARPTKARQVRTEVGDDTERGVASLASRRRARWGLRPDKVYLADAARVAGLPPEVRANARATVRLVVEHGDGVTSGSGGVIANPANDGTVHVVTARHVVVGGTPSVVFTDREGRPTPVQARIVRSIAEHDVVLLAVRPPSGVVVETATVDTRARPPGTSIHTFGFTSPEAISASAGGDARTREALRTIARRTRRLDGRGLSAAIPLTMAQGRTRAISPERALANVQGMSPTDLREEIELASLDEQLSYLSSFDATMTDLPIGPGSSGSPVFSADHRLIGIVLSGHEVVPDGKPVTFRAVFKPIGHLLSDVEALDAKAVEARAPL